MIRHKAFKWETYTDCGRFSANWERSKVTSFDNKVTCRKCLKQIKLKKMDFYKQTERDE
jgi:hypothetical protein